MKIEYKLGRYAVDRIQFQAKLDEAEAKHPFLHALGSILIEYSPYLTSAYGQCKAKRYRDSRLPAVVIGISKRYRECVSMEEVVACLAHEISHAIEMVKLGRMSHGEMFKRICKNLGGSMSSKYATGEFTSCQLHPGQSRVTGFRYEYRCKCGACIIKRNGMIPVNARRLDHACKYCGQWVRDFEITKNW